MKSTRLKLSKLTSRLIASCTLCLVLITPRLAYAQSEASAISALSALPVASVVLSASAVAGAVVTIPVVLSTTGAVLAVRTVESTARGTVYVLERASDGARVSVELVGKSIAGAALIAGTLVLVTVVSSGVLLSAAGEAIAFLPNSLGKALLYNERLTSI